MSGQWLPVHAQGLYGDAQAGIQRDTFSHWNIVLA